MKSIIENGFVKSAVNECGGSLHPLVFNWDRSKGCTIMNPSVCNDGGILRVNFRLTNYTLNHSQSLKYPAPSGCYQYIYSELNPILTSDNYICDLDEGLEVINPRFIFMRTKHSDGKWTYRGLEDARLISWNNKLYLSGTRRDTDSNGTGRIELVNVDIDLYTASESSRVRLQSTDQNSYCEKNWMPITNLPYCYIKWSNPTEVIKASPIDDRIELMIKGKELPLGFELRGGTHVVKYKDYYIAFGHSSKVWKPYSGSMDADYLTRIMIWDKNFKLIKVSEGFKMLDSAIEFQCGLCYDRDNHHMLISFSEMDNMSYICRFDPDWLLNLILN